MTFAEKLNRLIEESGWSVAEVTRRVGRRSSVTVLRWLGRTNSGRKADAKADDADAEPGRKKREYHIPGRQDLMALSDLFGVDIRWLIDDELGWEDQLKADNPILARIRRLPMEAQLEMWTLYSHRAGGESGGSLGWPREKPNGPGGESAEPGPKPRKKSS